VTSHPEPPPSFRLLVTSISGRWCRIHRTRHAPLHFGRTPRGRFDAPAGEFGVLYVARDAHGAFIETFGHETGVRYVTEKEVGSRAIALISTRRPFRLADLRGEGLARMGADARITSGIDYDLSRRWARAIHDHPRKPDGILYRARHDPARLCAAIFDRAERQLRAVSMGSLNGRRNRPVLADILTTYKFGLVP
jgi:hypothetical protein